MSGDRFKPFCFAAALSLLPSAQALANTQSTAADLLNLPLQDLINVQVTSVSKYAQKSSEAPSAVEVITADDIRTYGYRTLGEALDGLHGLYGSSDRNYNYLGVNGFLRPGDFNSRMLIMVDGHRINDDVYDSANSGQEFMMDMDLVDHIEYIAGPGSSIYGANAMEGVINVITRKGSDIKGMQVAGSAGTYDTKDARVTYGNTLKNGSNLLLSASQYMSGGVPDLFYPEFNTPANNHGVATGIDGERSRRLYASTTVGNFTLTGAYVDRYKEVPTGQFSTLFNDPGSWTNDVRDYAEIKYSKAFNDQTQIEVKTAYDGYYYWGHYPYDFNGGVGPVDRVVNYDSVSGSWIDGEATLVTSAFKRQKVVTGIDYQYDLRQQLTNYDIQPFTLYQNAKNSGLRSGVFVQDDIKLRSDLTFSAGLRLDQNHMIKHEQLNPRAGLIWNARQDTTLKLLYGSAFRAPNEYERALSYPGQFAPNPNNYEERVKNYQFIDEWTPARGLKLTCQLFDNNFTQVISQNAANLEYVNMGHFDDYGYDLEIEQRAADGKTVRISFDHTITRDESNGSGVWAVDAPKNVARAQYSQPLLNEEAKLGMEDVYVSRRKTLQPGMPDAAQYNLVNLNLSSTKVFPGSEASFGVYNIFNAHPQMVGGNAPTNIPENIIPLNGRTLQLKLQYTY